MPRKIILGFEISMDGYIARRNGAIDFLVIDKEVESVMAGFFANIDTTMMGRTNHTSYMSRYGTVQTLLKKAVTLLGRSRRRA